MRNIYFILLFLLPSLLSAQVTTDPVIVQHDQSVTIFYNAAQGQSTLQGATKVYMHAGVITSASTSDSDWKYVKGTWATDNGVGLMTKVDGQTDQWKITLQSPRAYFGVPAGERILKIGMVFRNADASKTGRNAQGGDIFVPVYEGFAVSISKPTATSVLASPSEQILIEATASAPANIIIKQGTQTLFSVSNSTGISFTYNFSGANDKEIIEVIATSGNNTASDQFEIVKKVSSPTATLPAGLKQGFNKTGNNQATFVLLAPGKQSVHLIGDFTNWEVNNAYLMNYDSQKELFWITVSNLDPATEYAYYYLVNQKTDIADPYSEKILDAGEDKWINAQRYPNLRTFPDQAATDRLSTFKLNEPAYNWQAVNYTRPAKSSLIIYELLIRDFSATEDIQGVIDQLDYLDSLHITAIQLMPVMEFNGNDSWGYNPTFQTALDKWYGTKNKLKELIDKAHLRGMAVILDIALNHQDYPAPFLKMWANGFGASADNPFFNVAAKHPFNVFTDMNHESAYTKQFVDFVNRYWLEEYRIDGYRFDLSKGFTQKNSGENVGAWSAYDASRVAILKRMADQIWSVDPNAYVILEHFADNVEEKELANYGMMLWGNLNHAYSEAAMGHNLSNNESNFNWISHKARGWNDPHVIGYMESHDEERMLYRLLQFGNANGSYSTRQLATALERIKMSAALFIPVPGPKMLWQFGELGYDVSIEQNGRTGKKPLKWNYLDVEARQDLFRTYSALNDLKTSYEVFNTNNFTLNGAGSVRYLLLDGANMDVQIIGNFDLTEKSASIPMPQTGYWWSYFSGDSVNVTGTEYQFTLAPGEFHMLFSEKVVFSKENPTASKFTPALSLKVNNNTLSDTLKLNGASTVSISAQTDLNATISITLNQEQVRSGTGKTLLHSLSLSPSEDPYQIVVSALRNGVLVRDTAIVVINSPNGISDPVFAQSIELLPNPTKDRLSVTFTQAPINTVRFWLTDLMGRELSIPVRVAKKNGNSYEIAAHDLAPGLYLLRIQEGDKIAVKRFIKQ